MKPLHPTALPLPISPLALGTWALAGDKFWGPQAEADSIATIHAALDAGVTLIDTAPAYGDGLSEQAVGKALRDPRDRALIATKISEADMTPEKAVASCEASLRRLQTDCIDLLQIHWLGTGEHLEDVIATMEKLRDAGKVRTLGVCNFGPQSLGRLRASGPGLVRKQMAYNPNWRALEIEIFVPFPTHERMLQQRKERYRRKAFNSRGHHCQQQRTSGAGGKWLARTVIRLNPPALQMRRNP